MGVELSWIFEIQKCFPKNDLLPEFGTRLLKIMKKGLYLG